MITDKIIEQADNYRSSNFPDMYDTEKYLETLEQRELVDSWGVVEKEVSKRKR